MSKTHIDNAAIRQLATLLDDTGLHEIEYETEALRIRIARGTTTVVSASPAPLTGPTAPTPVTEPAPSSGPEGKDHPGTVKAPMVGVIYLSPDPSAGTFTAVGRSVREGDTLMLIEAMKTFNPVKAPRSGRVASILVSDGQGVEHGEPLVIIE